MPREAAFVSHSRRAALGGDQPRQSRPAGAGAVRRGGMAVGLYVCRLVWQCEFVIQRKTPHAGSPENRPGEREVEGEKRQRLRLKAALCRRTTTGREDIANQSGGSPQRRYRKEASGQRAWISLTASTDPLTSCPLPNKTPLFPQPWRSQGGYLQEGPLVYPLLQDEDP